jgi:hypothetical protein
MGICLIVKSGGGTDTSNANVTADKILSGYTVYSNDNKITGIMSNNGTQTASGLNAGDNAAIKAGWHNGNGTVTTNTLSSQTSADIPDASWCLTGYSYWKNGVKYTGTMSNKGTKTWSLGANGSQTIEGGWHNGNGTVSQSINVDNGEWGPTPTTTNQQLCWQGWYYSKNRWCWGNGNLVAGNIKKGVSIFGVWGNYVETRRMIIENGALTNLCSYGYTSNNSNVPSETISWNNATWRLISSECWWYVDSDEGSSIVWQTALKISGWKKYVSTSYTVGAHRGTFGFMIKGDFIAMPFNGYGSGSNKKGIVCLAVTIGTGISPNMAANWYNGIIFYDNTGSSCIVATYTPVQFGDPNASNYVSKRNGSQYAEDNMYIDCYESSISRWGHNHYGTTVYAKNLWLDTTKTMAN